MYKNIIFVCIVALVVYGGTFLNKNKSFVSENRNDTSWYAVYMNNNQVYFGHITSIKKDLLVLSDVHYAESYQEPAQVSVSEKFAVEQAPKQMFRIIQKGKEPMLASDHNLFINRASVLYWEKLSEDAEVAKFFE